MGWETNDGWGGPRGIWRGGGMPGASDWLQLFPTEKIAIVVLSDARSNLPDQLKQE